MNNSPHFQHALRLGHLMYGVSPGEFAEKQAFSRAIESSPDMSRLICKLAASMYEAAGKTEQFQYHFYDQLSKTANWDPAFDEFVEPVVTALDSVVGQMQTEETEKRASWIAPAATMELVGQGAAMSPAMLKWLAAAGIGTGAAVGSLGWFANRDVNEDDADLEAMQARTKNYNRITKEISDALRAQGRLPVTRDTEDLIEQTANAPVKR